MLLEECTLRTHDSSRPQHKQSNELRPPTTQDPLERSGKYGLSILSATLRPFPVKLKITNIFYVMAPLYATKNENILWLLDIYDITQINGSLTWIPGIVREWLTDNLVLCRMQLIRMSDTRLVNPPRNLLKVPNEHFWCPACLKLKIRTPISHFSC